VRCGKAYIIRNLKGFEDWIVINGGLRFGPTWLLNARSLNSLGFNCEAGRLQASEATIFFGARDRRRGVYRVTRGEAS